MWIDTHCHLDCDAFDADRDEVVARARAAGVTMAVLASAHADHFSGTAQVARRYGFVYALGMHPLWLDTADEAHVEVLRDAVRAALGDPQFVAVGEIGLDYFVPGLDVTRQQWFYREQLRIARDHDLPVIVHVRRSADALLQQLRRIDVPGGIAHAFNGSEQQAQQFIDRGFKLGFGGAMTYGGSLRIRRLAKTVPDHAWVLETDSPDIPPQWLRADGTVKRNELAELPRIARTLGELRGKRDGELAQTNRANACAALPRLGAWLQQSEARVGMPDGMSA